MSGAVAGFYGKLPARGDFVRVGLPRDFTDHWDMWLQSVISGSRASMGEAWLPAFLESPVWRFALAPGICGQRAVVGLMLPSVDKAGRYFPLTFALLLPEGVDIGETAGYLAWLDRCEDAGRAALEQDATPEQMTEMLGDPEVPNSEGRLAGATWWTDGSPTLPPTRLPLPGLPDAATYAWMLAAPVEATPSATSGEAVMWKPSS